MALRLTRALRLAATLPKANRSTVCIATTTAIGITTQPNKTSTNKKTTVLEVERKFRRLTLPTLTNIHLPPSTPGPKPIFKSVLPLPTRQIHDIYYDTPARTLCAAGAWIRKRNGEWEAKINNKAAWGGDFVNSRFEEVCGREEVGGCVAKVLGTKQDLGKVGVGTGGVSGGAVGGDDNFGLETLAEFVTTREAWLVDGEFKVVRDQMDFGHEVGEVELQVEVCGRDGEVMGEEEKGVVMEEMDQRIERFMERYAWAWERGDAVGKLTAYFEMVKRRGGGWL